MEQKKYLFLFIIMSMIVYPVIPRTYKIKFGKIFVENKEFSEDIKKLAGKKVKITGYMAPPLKPDANFFVLTRQPMAVCPFCDDEEEWPEDIIFVRTKKTVPPIQQGEKIEVTGILELGVEVDSQTGFVSLIRIVNAKIASY